MSTERFWAVRCDSCGFDLDTSARTAGAARRTAAEEGWSRPKLARKSQLRGDWCPICTEERAS